MALPDFNTMPLDELVEQRHRPQMRIIRQTLADIADVVVEPVAACRAGTHPGDTITAQIRPDRLGVTAQMPGDHRDLPALLEQRMRVDVFLPCEHADGAPSVAGGGQRPSASKGAPPTWWTTQVGNFSEQN